MLLTQRCSPEGERQESGGRCRTEAGSVPFGGQTGPPLQTPQTGALQEALVNRSAVCGVSLTCEADKRKGQKKQVLTTSCVRHWGLSLLHRLSPRGWHRPLT